MLKSPRWLAVAVVLVGVGLFFMWRGCRSDNAGRPTSSGEFGADGIALTSPDLDLALAAVRTTAHPGYTDWACLLECTERGGCRADIRVRILYRAAGEKRSLNLSGRLDAARGETTRIGRVQRPAVAIERIDEVIVEVVAPFSPDAPRPTPVL